MNDLITQEWYQALVDECKAIITEAVHNSRWDLIEGYWNLGKRIREENNLKREDIYRKKILSDLSKSIEIGERTVYRAIQAYDKYPDINTLPEGKNITWNKLITIYLPEVNLPTKEIIIPKGKYSCIVVDPPWPIPFIDRKERPLQVDIPYPVMTLDKIRELPIAEIASENCHLYLWTTHKFLPDCFDIVRAWGFEYQCLMTWVKNVGFCPFSWMYTTEHVLFCRKGSLPLLKKGLRLDFSAKVREHSRKPDIFYDLVKQASPEPRIDMFSREKREGYDQWGNEEDKFI